MLWQRYFVQLCHLAVIHAASIVSQDGTVNIRKVQDPYDEDTLFGLKPAVVEDLLSKIKGVVEKQGCFKQKPEEEIEWPSTPLDRILSFEQGILMIVLVNMGRIELPIASPCKLYLAIEALIRELQAEASAAITAAPFEGVTSTTFGKGGTTEGDLIPTDPSLPEVFGAETPTAITTKVEMGGTTEGGLVQTDPNLLEESPVELNSTRSEVGGTTEGDLIQTNPSASKESGTVTSIAITELSPAELNSTISEVGGTTEGYLVQNNPSVSEELEAIASTAITEVSPAELKSISEVGGMTTTTIMALPLEKLEPTITEMGGTFEGDLIKNEGRGAEATALITTSQELTSTIFELGGTAEGDLAQGDPILPEGPGAEAPASIDTSPEQLTLMIFQLGGTTEGDLVGTKLDVSKVKNLGRQVPKRFAGVGVSSASGLIEPKMPEDEVLKNAADLYECGEETTHNPKGGIAQQINGVVAEVDFEEARAQEGRAPKCGGSSGTS